MSEPLLRTVSTAVGYAVTRRAGFAGERTGAGVVVQTLPASWGLLCSLVVEQADAHKRKLRLQSILEQQRKLGHFEASRECAALVSGDDQLASGAHKKRRQGEAPREKGALTVTAALMSFGVLADAGSWAQASASLVVVRSRSQAAPQRMRVAGCGKEKRHWCGMCRIRNAQQTYALTPRSRHACAGLHRRRWHPEKPGLRRCVRLCSRSQLPCADANDAWQRKRQRQYARMLRPHLHRRSTCEQRCDCCAARLWPLCR